MVSPKVSIIIINLNGKNSLSKCLESLFKINYDNFEVILVDNNSNDGSVEFVTQKYPSIILIKLNTNKGFAEPNNIGTKIATGEFLLFLNNDTIVTPDFLKKLVFTAKSDSKIAICQSLLLKPNGDIDSSGDFVDSLGVVFSSKTLPNKNREIFSAKGASMLMRKDIFQKLNGFDEKFFATFEDVDLGWRTWISGYKVMLIPDSIVYHIGSTTIKTLKHEIAFHGFKNQLSMKITNFETILSIKVLFKFLILYGLRELKIWLDYSLKGSTKLTPTKYENDIAKKPSFKIILKSIFWVLSNQKYLRKKHQFVNSTRLVSTNQLKKLKIISN